MALYSKINLQSTIRSSFLVYFLFMISISSLPVSCILYASTSVINYTINESNQLSLEQEANSDFNLLWQNSPTRLNPEWIKHLGGDRLDWGDDFVQNSQGNIYVAGTSFTPVYSTGNVDITLFEVDASSGNVIWNKKWDRTEFDYVSGIAEGNNGRVFLAGTTRNTYRNVARNYSQENFDLFLLSYDPIEKQWINHPWSWGETDINEYCNDVIFGDDGYIYLVGTSQSNNNDIIVTKFDGTNNVPIWIQFYGGEDIEEGNTLVYGNDGYLYVLGTRSSSSISSQFYILKIDTESGESLWHKSWPMSPNEGLSLLWGANNSLYVTGTSYNDNSDLIVVKLDLNSGELIWTAVWGTNNRDYGSDLAFFNQNLLVLGTANETGSVGGEVVLIEINPETGDIQYVSLWGSLYQEMGKKLLINQLNNSFYILGTIETSSESNYNSDILIGHFTLLTTKKDVFEGVFRIGLSVIVIGLCLFLVIRTRPKKVEKI